MSVANFIPNIWSARLLITLRKQLVFPMLMNRNWEGEIQNQGDTVKIQTPLPGTIAQYTKASTTIDYEDVTSSTQDLVVDQRPHFAFNVDDAEKVQANVDLVETFMDQYGYQMADTVDADLAGVLYTGATGAVALDVSLNYDAVRAAIVEVGRTLSDANVPYPGRWLVVSPTVESALRLSPEFTPASNLGDEIKVAGAIGRIEGFQVYMSNNIDQTTTHNCVAGTNRGGTIAMQPVPTVEGIRLEGKFEDGIRGQLLYGRKVVDGAALCKLTVTV